jgi:hypothetical protein
MDAGLASERTADRAFVGVSALLFATSAALPIVWCAFMAMRGMTTPGGSTMSMVWMRMPRTDVARGRGVVHQRVGRDDGSDDVAVVDANALALPPGRR